MLEINAKIIKKRTNKVNINISKNLPEDFELKVESEVQVRTPKDKEEKTVLILVETSIRTPDSDDIDIILNAEFIFEFDGVPDEYDSILKEEVIPLAQKDLFKVLDNILIEMGYEKLGLAEEQ